MDPKPEPIKGKVIVKVKHKGAKEPSNVEVTGGVWADENELKEHFTKDGHEFIGIVKPEEAEQA